MLKLNDLKNEIFDYIEGLLQENGMDFFDVNNHTSRLLITPKKEYRAKFDAYAENRQIKLKKDRYFNIQFPIDLRREHYENDFLRVVSNQNDINSILNQFKEEITKDFQENFLKNSVFIDLITYLKNDESYPAQVNNEAVGTFGYLDKILIIHFFCIVNEVVLENLKDKKEIYFLGENGDGKTLLLQAILMVLKYDFITNYAKKEETYVGKILDIINESEAILYAQDSYSKYYTYHTLKSPTFLHIGNPKYLDVSEKSVFLGTPSIPKFISNIFAYGVHRSRSNAKNPELYGFGTLFSDDIYLKSPTDWLLKIKLDETEEGYQGIKLTNAVEILEHLLADNVKIKINGSKVKFIERGFEVDFNELSEGYKSVMTWVADLVSRLAENQPDVKPVEIEGKIGFPYQGIVLVDEISLHLHPKWEYDLVRKLRGWFPNIQFIMTTHSPVTVLGASEEAVFFKVYKENGITKVKPYEELQLGNMRADQILTSEFFGLASARPAYLQEYMNLRKEILTKTELTKEDEGKLKKLEDRYGTLPTGETKEELKTKMLLNEVLNHLKANDKNK